MRVTLLAALAAMGWAVSPPVMAQSVVPALTLEDAVARSLEASPLLNAKEAAIAASGAGVDQAGVKPNPQIDVEIENFTGSGPYSDFGSTETTVTYRQPLERGGKRRARVALAEADRGIARLERARSAAEVAFDTQRAWNAMQEAVAMVANGEERLRLAEEMAAIVHRRVKAARDPLAAGLKADNQVADARTGLEQARRTMDAAREALAAQWDEETVGLAIDGSVFFRLSEGPDANDAPDLAVNEAQIERAGRSFDLEKSRARQDPTIGIGMRRFEDGGDVAGVVSFSLPLAFFDRNRGNINRAMAERQEAQWMLAEAQRKQAAALRSARSAREAARAEAAAIRDDMIPRAIEAARSSRDGYDRGAFAYLDVADTQRTVVDLRSRLVAALRKFHEAQAVIDRLTGRWTMSDAAQEF